MSNYSDNKKKKEFMTNLVRSNFQDHPFHLVSPSPWPFYTSISLFTLTMNAALSMHLFNNSYIFLYIALFLVISSMSLWFRDIIAEGKRKVKNTLYYHLNIAQKIYLADIENALHTYKITNNSTVFSNKDDLGYYLAGLLEGDGCIYLPSLGVTSLNRVLNPRITFTSHINNIGMYSFLQSELGNIGRFQRSSENVLRYIIGDKESIIFIISLIHGKLRTPKNKRFNHLIHFMNNKYNLNISESLLDNTNLKDNSWFAGFFEADGHFGIKYVERKAKSETRQRSVSENVSLKFRLDQRSYDKATSSSMEPFMENLALFLNADLKRYEINNSKLLSVSVQSIRNVGFLIDYFNKHPLIGDKLNDFKKWKTVYDMILLKEHITEEGRLKIRKLIGK